MKIELYKSIEDEDGYVGIKIDCGITKVFFPYGYPVDLLKSKKDNEIKKEIRELLYSLIGTNARSELNSRTYLDSENSYLFDCIYLIDDYLINGLHFKNSRVISANGSGRIIWNRTIKNQIPLVSFYDGKPDALFYPKLYKHKNIKCEDIITKMEKYALKIAKDNIGFLYGDFEIDSNELDNPLAYIPYLENLLSTVYIDTEKKLIESIINIITNKGNYDTPVNLKLGTYNYNIVWENMLRKVYGTIDENKYFPTTSYTLKTVNDEKFEHKIYSSMRPDLIFKPFDKKEYYIIDAKYYKYCETSNDINSLPNSESISKQIIYQQKIEEQLIEEGVFNKFQINMLNPVHSLFILPFDKTRYDKKEFISSELDMLAFKGFGSIEAKSNNNTTYLISLAFKDTRDLIFEYNYGKKYHYDREYKGIISGYDEYMIAINNYKKSGDLY